MNGFPAWISDSATTDSDGCIYILGRADFQLMRDGLRISPSEGEEVLGTRPAAAAPIVLRLPDGDRQRGEARPPGSAGTVRRGPGRGGMTARSGPARHGPGALPALAAPIIARARRQPDWPALRWRDETVTYAELAGRVRAVAASVAASTSPRARVAVEARRDAGTVCAILGVLAAGRSYVPLNPREPDSRRASMLAMAGASHQVSGDLIAPLPARPLPAGPAPPPQQAAPHGDEAFVFFTSGSTGAPKGVPVSHGNALAFAEWARGAFALSSSDRIGVYSPLFFDLAVFDLFAGLSAGAELVLVPDELVPFPRAAFDVLCGAAVTVLYTVPSALRRLLAAAAGRRLPNLRHLLLAGEPFPADELDRIRRTAPQAVLHNLYGPIETNVVSHFTVPRDWPAGQRAPIGTAASGAVLALLGEDGGKRVLREGPGRSGEILIRGPSVFRGYLPGPAAPPDPFLRVAGQRWYRSGDMGRWNADGGLEFEGRRDHRIKRHGFLVDLSEIEAVLARHPDVAMAAVIALDRGGPETPVHAFVSPARGCGLDAETQLQWCRRHLPRYMWPSRIHVLPSLPIGRTGKVDRQRLTAMAGRGPAMARGERR